MKQGLQEINHIISICDKISDYISKNGTVSRWTGGELYNDYRDAIKAFFDSRPDIDKPENAFRAVIQAFLYNPSSNYTLNMSEITVIRSTLIEIKHRCFPNDFERIFISHREKDKAQVEAFVELLHSIGIPRPTQAKPENMIFCTSHPASYLQNGCKNLDTIHEQFQGHSHTYYILWYTDNYFESQACLNEAGAIWVMNKRYQEILSPTLSSGKIGGLLDKQFVWFRSNDKYRLNTFKEQLEAMFSLSPITQNAWESARDRFIAQIENTSPAVTE